jgi:hypothetical protein
VWGMRRNEESEGGRGSEGSKQVHTQRTTHSQHPGPRRPTPSTALRGNEVVVVAGKGMTRGHITIIME